MTIKINTAKWFVDNETTPFAPELETHSMNGGRELRKRSTPAPYEGPPSPPLHGRNTRAAERAERQWSAGLSSSHAESSSLGFRSTQILPPNDLQGRRRSSKLMQSSEEDMLGNYGTVEDEEPFETKPAKRRPSALSATMEVEASEDGPGPAYAAPRESKYVYYDDDGTGALTDEGELNAKDEDGSEYDEGGFPAPRRTTTTRSGRSARRIIVDSDEEDEVPVRRAPSRRPHRSVRDFVAPDDEENAFDEPERDWEDPDDRKARLERLADKRREQKARLDERQREMRELNRASSKPAPRTTRNSRAAAADDDEWHDNGEESEEDGGTYPLRKRKEVNYKLPTLEDLAREEQVKPSRWEKPKKRRKFGHRTLPFSMSGAQLGALFGERPPAADSSDDDATPRKRPKFPNGMTPGALFAGAAGSANMFDLAAGTPSNLGRISGATNLADTDPLLPASSISFDNVGGLDSHIQQLKEMVSLPLLYPEVFRRFNITPPRGVLFHGPPGTGKTLLARALAASCSTEGQRISFFMRKGADCLSKWVGEAERQLRLLFEEARASQPSIIFFDEIDGLAPVRSSKQEQIHASIVSTLLALMDGMDGRGQVIVIGATNRPDAIDPALRRPGRFDREFYFPLPNVEGRRKILEIHTKGWEPPMPISFLEELALMTKGYGGADLRALCTEAALNAVQRRYPQIYKSSDRLLIKPETIDIRARDFVIAAQRLIPSSTRATSSIAAPLPTQMQPLLVEVLEQCKTALQASLPQIQRVNVLEEAEYEQDDTDVGFEKEKQTQAFEALRVHRPRLLIYGPAGMGQSFLGPAILQHLEGYHVQSLDLGNLVSDSSRTLEAACVQLFTEARRHKPSILYIPSLSIWASAVTDTVKATIKGLLDGLDPSEPILLLAVLDGLLSEVPADIRSWFGFLQRNRVLVEAPDAAKREAFFADAITSLRKPPTDFADVASRKKRVLEDLPKAPPPPPRKPTAAEIEAQLQHDRRVLDTLKFLLGPILTDLKRRFKRFTNTIGEPAAEPVPTVIEPESEAVLPPENEEQEQPKVNGVSHSYAEFSEDELEIVGEAPATEANGGTMEPEPSGDDTAAEADGVDADIVQAEAEPEKAALPAVTEPEPFKFHDIDLDQMHEKLYYGHYYTPSDFLADINLIVANAEHDEDDEQLIRALAMQNQAQLMVDQACDRHLQIECAKVAVRAAERRKEAKSNADDDDAAPAEDEKEPESSPVERVGSKRKSDDEDDDQPLAKRARGDNHGVSESTVLGGDGNFEAGVPSNNLMEGVEQTGSAAEPLLPLATKAPAAPHHVRVDPADPAMTTSIWPPAVSAQGLQEHFAPAKAPSPPAPVRYVELDESRVFALASLLRDSLEGFTVEQLEQLRAAIYDTIWRHRAQWERDALVAELHELVNEFLEEIRMLEED